MEHTIEVRQEDIDKAVEAQRSGNYEISCHCVVAQAVSRQFGVRIVTVGRTHFFTRIKGSPRHTFDCPDIYSVTGLSADLWHRVKPFTFVATEVEIAG